MDYKIWCTLMALLVTVHAQDFGYTSPKGPINLLVGETVNIVCVIDLAMTDGYNSSYLNFYARNPLDPKYISIINETAIELNIPNAGPWSAQYICKLKMANRTVGIGYNDVLVGYVPSPVQNFKCRSHNWQNMTCTFEKVANPVVCNYELTFRLESEKGAGFEYTCIVKPMFDNKTFSCMLTTDSKGGIYRQPYDTYYFSLRSWNQLGSLTEEFIIDHYAIVIPDPPQNLTGIDTTPTGTKLVWKTPIEMQSFPRRLVYSISYMSEFDNGVWNHVDTMVTSTLNKPTTYILQNLPYAYVEYDVRVRSKTEPAEDTPDMWSINATYLFRSGSREPDAPPRTDVGGFYVDDNDHVYVYWKELEKFRQNGPHFKYIVTCTTHPKILRSMNNAFMNKYASVTANRYEDLEFTISSHNDVGNSLESSSIRVPRKSERCEPPGEIRNILHNKNGPGRKYVFSWGAPRNVSQSLTSYTVFWCMARNESPNQCDGSFDFERVPSHVTSFERVTDHTLNFAVSANSNTSSSGMVWARCTAIANNDINKVTDTKTNAGSDTASFEWNTACIDESLSHGYLISYCLVNGDRDNTNCTESQKNISIVGAAIHNYTLKNLTPYSTYKVTIAAQSLAKIGPLSDPVYFTTLESSPTPPLSLIVINVNSSSATLQWDPPAEMNGVLNRYAIYYNNLRSEVPKVGNAADRITYVLTGLMANTNYDIGVIACTGARHCSNSSNRVYIRTDVGIPGSVQIESIDHNIIKWKAPAVPAGNLDFYEMKVSIKSMEGDLTEVVYLNGTSCTIAFAVNCQMNETHVFSVRAVNVMHTPHGMQRRDLSAVGGASSLAQTYMDIDTLPTSSSLSSHEKRHSSYDATPVHHSFNTFADLDPIETTTYRPSHRHRTICKEEDQTIPHRIRKLDKHATLLKGEYVIVRNERCGMSDAMMLPLMLIVLFGMIVATYLVIMYVCKKIKKIKDIDIDMPEGMKEIIQDTGSGKNVGGPLAPLDIGRMSDVNRSEKLFTRAAEQEESLLPWQRNRSVSSLNSGDEERVSTCDEEAPFDSSEQGDDLRSARTMSESLGDEKLYSTNTSNDGYTRSPNMFGVSPVVMPVMTSFSPTPMPHQAPRPMSTFGSNNNYVPASMMMRPSSVNANGYVTHDAIAARAADLASRQTNNSGYMPHSVAIAVKSPVSPIAVNPDDSGAKVAVVALTDDRGISGYVTHKQLSDFGQLIQ